MNKIAVSAAIVMCALSSAVYADEAEVQALAEACEVAREVKLKPLREAEIERCKAEARNEPGYCERYWSDYGNAKRMPNGTMQPRMFDDLPECVAAEEARQALKSK